MGEIDLKQFLDYYADEKYELSVPSKNIIEGHRGNKKTKKISLSDSLDNPIGSEKLVDLAYKSEKIVLVVEDHTRHSPVYETLVELKKRFSSNGIPWNRVTILVATGTHRMMTDRELGEKFREFTDFSKIIQHNAYDSENIIDYGSFLDVPLKINAVVEADLTVCIGAIVPHRFSGWSGGSKMIVPGVAGYETVFKSHHMAILNSNANVGIAKNKFRSLINEAGKRAGVDFIINYYFDANGKIAGCVSGNPVAAHEEGIKLAEKEVEVIYNRRSDVTFISSYPSVNDFWQSGKALYTADLITKDGGKIVMISPLFEGFGDHPVFAQMLRKNSGKILKELESLSGEDPLAYVAAYAVKKIMEKKEIHIISETEYVEDFKKIGLKITGESEPLEKEVLDKNLKVIVLNNCLILPKIKNQEVFI